ncbi:MAG: response regulator [Candidatus Thiodiazotropha sp. (ex Rostrolucina anterorostrata)]|nr:response regulator [Candidatus Thiodiazotropha sp. (ex Rostrolucina anterorostrata)]
MTTALVIEDNPDNMLLICDILEFNDCGVLKAETGLQGVSMAKELVPDFILLDIQLPDIDGYKVLQRIRASEEARSIPIVAMTSYAMVGDREKLMDSGCDGYIEKPIDPGVVMEQIQRAIGGKA